MSTQVRTRSDDFGKDHGDGLTKHDSFGFNTTNTPTGNTETVDHGSVRVSTDDGIGVEHVLTVHNNASEVLKVDLMDDTGAWGNDLEVVEGLRAPLKELEALAVTFEFHLFVEFGSIPGAGGIDLN
jgi:hypothetical protein